MTKIVEWARTFQVWQYSVSHSTLILRSIDADRYLTRIDVAFFGVELMHLRAGYNTLAIGEVDVAEDRERLLDTWPGERPAGTLFLINEGEGCVVARRLSWHEDDGDHHAPSKFGPLRGTE